MTSVITMLIDRTVKAHKKSVHEGVMYSCDNCDYQVAHPRNLINHQKSIHEGVRYSCDKCDYHAKRQDNLHAHKKNVHERKRRNFQSGRKRELNKHKSKEHRLLE